MNNKNIEDYINNTASFIEKSKSERNARIEELNNKVEIIKRPKKIPYFPPTFNSYRVEAMKKLGVTGGMSNATLAHMISRNTKLKYKKTKKGVRNLIRVYATGSASNASHNKINTSDFYRSREWRGLRYKALVKYGRKCMCCGATPQHGAVMHVDHIKPRSKHPELELSLNNLQILCEDCNMGKSNISSKDFRFNDVEIINEEDFNHMLSIKLEG